jgi:quercetin dioxygenase-like cupin family protein
MMREAHLSELRRFSTTKFLPELVYGSAGARVFLLCLEPGQGLPLRRDSEEVVCYVLEGRLRLRRGEEDLKLEAGDLVGVGPGELRGITAEVRAVVLWIQLANRRVEEPKVEKSGAGR